MESAMNHKQKLKEFVSKQEEANFSAELNRARSVTVGTSFGGTTELMMRGNGGNVLWCTMQPVEVVELIHQLAANIGCHMALQPRNDFSSWREWRISEAEKKHLNRHPPFVNDMAVFQRVGMTGFDQKRAEAAIEEDIAQKEYEYVNGGAKRKELKHEAVATKKIVNKCKPK
jgi:hypothetical protein